MSGNPKALVHSALESGEFLRLLMGEPEYRYMPPRSLSPWDTDLTVLLDVIYDCDDPVVRALAKRELTYAAREAVERYRGLIPVAICVLVESAKKVRGRELGLPVAELAGSLRKGIVIHASQLSCDYTGGGAMWPDGLLGELRRLSQNCAAAGGPSFVE